jgi:hypothetical protein
MFVGVSVLRMNMCDSSASWVGRDIIGILSCRKASYGDET